MSNEAEEAIPALPSKLLDPEARARCQKFLEEYRVLPVANYRPGIGEALILQMVLKLLAKGIIDEDTLADIVIDAAEYYDFKVTGKLPELGQ